METIVGNGKYTYKVHEDWAHVPVGVDMKPAAVAVDPHDRVYCFNRSPDHPVVVFDRSGEFLFSWGAGIFRFPHAIRFDAEGFAWLTDEHHMQFMKFTPEGELLQTIGLRGHRRSRRRLQLTGMGESDAWRWSLQPADRYRLRTGRLNVYERWLRQRPRSQILTPGGIPGWRRAGSGQAPHPCLRP